MDIVDKRRSGRFPGGPVFGPCAQALLAHAVLAAELVNATAGVDDLLLARVEGVARGTYFDQEILAERGTRLEFVATTTGNLDGVVIGVNVGFHLLALRSTLLCKKGA